jgi:DNA-nicking Smr family endonuclease
MRRRTAITPEDASLFREAIGAVRPLASKTPAPAPPKPQPRAAQRERDESEALRDSRLQPFGTTAEPLGEPSAYRRPELGERQWRKLRRGQFAIQDEIDLHQMDARTAESSMRRFLIECRQADHLCVRLIHGKGLHSKAGGPVLRSVVEAQLRRRIDVLAYVSAPPAMGGTGALLVLLSRRRASETAGQPADPSSAAD